MERWKGRLTKQACQCVCASAERHSLHKVWDDVSSWTIHRGISCLLGKKKAFLPDYKLSQYVNAGEWREIPRYAGHVVVQFLKWFWLPAESFSKSVCMRVYVCVRILEDLSTLSIFAVRSHSQHVKCGSLVSGPMLQTTTW